MQFTTQPDLSNTLLLHWKTENWGAVGQIAKKLNVTSAHVSMVLHGKRRSLKIEREIAKRVGSWVRERVKVGRTIPRSERRKPSKTGSAKARQ